jgi:probable F420-dependent oxidoreductase
MKYATMISSLQQAQEQARALELLGYDTLLANETKHDPFVLSALMATQTTSVELMSYIVVAFARTPMLTAHSAHDLNSLSKGRFVLGLGSQIKAHITRRYAMPWSRPAARMKEYIQALHAIWDCWYAGKPLQFSGHFYSHTLTSPMFTPQDTQHGRPKVMLAAVGPAMTKVAAEIADGLLCHSFTTERYLRQVTLPSIEQTLLAHGRPRSQFRVVGMPLLAVGTNSQELSASIAAAKRQIAFYASTPAYKAVLDCHGWGDVQPEMLRLSKRGQWQEMGELLRDDILQAFCIIGTPDECARQIRQRYTGVYDQICGYQGDSTGLPPQILKTLKQ